ncbi:TetR/AcrR family transcriptional regulator [Streptomyces sp. NPDC001288]|uniref:TetR/AcrR family transcriptional regulator n=1 Tax=Streptomyces sp. NPDC001297 TaxID=3364559 RepID=UPI00369295A5
MPKVSQEYMDARRAQILDAARRCFLRDGFHSTSMQDLFAESGLSAGAVYRHFASKDDMILAIAEENMRDVLALVHTVATTRPGGSVGAVLAEVLDLVTARSAAQDTSRLAVLAWSEALRNPALAAQFATLLAQMRSDLAEVVREHQETGALPAEVTADKIAGALVCLLPGYILQVAMLDPAQVAGVSEAVRALWPADACKK